VIDAVVVGGGPAGSVCASRLARRGRSVVVLEKAVFPRFHLGESLLPQSLPVLAEIGVLADIEARFMPKYGARFHDDVTGRTDRFPFAGAWRGEADHAFQVPRAEFDAALLTHARASGADVRESWTVREVVREGPRAVGVLAEDPSGAQHTIGARFVVDATGRDALTAHDARATEKIAGLDQTALFAHFEGVPRAEGQAAGDIDIVLFRASASARPNWFWFIPFKGGRTSVGAVVSRAWVREATRDGAEGTGALFARAVADSPTATRMLADARMLWPRAEATADFSYRVRDLVGDGMLAIGDAAGFIDPLFSTGAHLAMCGGLRAADAIVDVLEGADETTRLAAHAAELRAGVETFVLAVQAFYAGPLVDYLFAEDKHTVLRRSITSLLAGDVWHDSVWLRDARRRFADMASAPPPPT
jgi:flavin-dependent dehydrogenase